jgi:hypothetical protein
MKLSSGRIQWLWPTVCIVPGNRLRATSIFANQVFVTQTPLSFEDSSPSLSMTHSNRHCCGSPRRASACTPRIQLWMLPLVEWQTGSATSLPAQLLHPPTHLPLSLRPPPSTTPSQRIPNPDQHPSPPPPQPPTSEARSIHLHPQSLRVWNRPVWAVSSPLRLPSLSPPSSTA